MVAYEDMHMADQHAHRIDPLDDIERAEGVELPGPMHDEAEKPIKRPKKLRGSKHEGYYPMRRRRG